MKWKSGKNLGQCDLAAGIVEVPKRAADPPRRTIASVPPCTAQKVTCSISSDETNRSDLTCAVTETLCGDLLIQRTRTWSFRILTRISSSRKPVPHVIPSVRRGRTSRCSRGPRSYLQISSHSEYLRFRKKRASDVNRRGYFPILLRRYLPHRLLQP